MYILIGCEESQEVCKAFRRLGHEAYSCDLIECSGGCPIWHLQMDVLEAIVLRKWDLIILHPVCTAMALSGNRYYGKGKVFHSKRIEAIKWTINLWELAKLKCDKVVLENPMSVIFQYLEEADVQYIHPWEFGHGECKKTGLALYGVNRLKSSEIVSGREERIWKMPPSKDRAKLRSKTFIGIANAFAVQWGGSLWRNP